jgi:hypothetical protein
VTVDGVEYFTEGVPVYVWVIPEPHFQMMSERVAVCAVTDGVIVWFVESARWNAVGTVCFGSATTHVTTCFVVSVHIGGHDYPICGMSHLLYI